MRNCPVCECVFPKHTHTNTYTDTRGLRNLKEALHTPSSACVTYEAAEYEACGTFEVRIRQQRMRHAQRMRSRMRSSEYSRTSQSGTRYKEVHTLLEDPLTS